MVRPLVLLLILATPLLAADPILAPDPPVTKRALIARPAPGLTLKDTETIVVRSVTVPQDNVNAMLTLSVASDGVARLAGDSFSIYFLGANLDALTLLLKKSLAWDEIARTKQVEPFSKPLGTIDGTTLLFRWSGTRSDVNGLYPITIENALKLLAEYPAALEEAQSRKKKAAAEFELFQ